MNVMNDGSKTASISTPRKERHLVNGMWVAVYVCLRLRVFLFFFSIPVCHWYPECMAKMGGYGGSWASLGKVFRIPLLCDVHSSDLPAWFFVFFPGFVLSFAFLHLVCFLAHARCWERQRDGRMYDILTCVVWVVMM